MKGIKYSEVARFSLIHAHTHTHIRRRKFEVKNQRKKERATTICVDTQTQWSKRPRNKSNEMYSFRFGGCEKVGVCVLDVAILYIPFASMA